MRTCTPRSRHARICASAPRKVHSVSGRIRSVASAIAMNSSGRDRALRRMEPAQQRFGALAPCRCAGSPAAGNAARAGRWRWPSAARRRSRACARCSRRARRRNTRKACRAAWRRTSPRPRGAAASARRSHPAGYRAMPMLTPTSIEMPATSMGVRRQSASSCEAVAMTASFSGRSSTTVNSSPPIRAMKPRSPERLLESLRDVAQHAVADVVAERVVDFLEAAQVEHEQRDVGGAARPASARFEVREQRGAVRQAGQRIVRGLVLQAALLRAALADVAHDGGVQPLGVEPHAAHRNLDREHFAVERARVALADHAVQRAEPRARAVTREQRDELGDRLVDELVGGAAEQARRGGVRGLDDAGFVDADDAVGRGLHHALEQRIAAAHAERVRQRAPGLRLERAQRDRDEQQRDRPASARRCRARADRTRTRRPTGAGDRPTSDTRAPRGCAASSAFAASRAAPTSAVHNAEQRERRPVRQRARRARVDGLGGQRLHHDARQRCRRPARPACRRARRRCRRRTPVLPANASRGTRPSSTSTYET